MGDILIGKSSIYKFIPSFAFSFNFKLSLFSSGLMSFYGNLSYWSSIWSILNPKDSVIDSCNP